MTEQPMPWRQVWTRTFWATVVFLACWVDTWLYRWAGA